jgi:hypothetical protein
MMDKQSMMDMALEKILNEIEDVEGKDAITHAPEHCLDPMSCAEHSDMGVKDMDDMDNNMDESVMGKPAAIEISVEKQSPMMMKESELSDEEKDALAKLLG